MTLSCWRSLVVLMLVIPCLSQADTLRSQAREESRLTAPNCPAATGRSFAGKDLTGHNFHAEPEGSLRGANFEGAILKGAVFDGLDLTGASFKGADLGPSSNGDATFAKTMLDHTCAPTISPEPSDLPAFTAPAARTCSALCPPQTARMELQKR